MEIEQIYTQCLAQGAYYIKSGKEAIVIDPLREVDAYIDRAKKDGVEIKYIFETHFHADFVSGHLDLAQKTGANIVYGPFAEPKFQAIVAEDKQIFRFGEVSIEVLHTPGHTMESTCYLLKNEKGVNQAIFTGDTLFIGDVGRPDLVENIDVNLTQEKLAAMMYDSLREKILPLEDNIIVYPAHGAGSACGKNMSKETFDTLGNQKQTNYALRQMSREQFVQEVLSGLSEPPKYFMENTLLNQNGYESLDIVMKRSLLGLSVEEFEEKIKTQNPMILDTRASGDFHQGFIPKSYNIGIDGGFAPWVGSLILNIKTPILIIADEGREQEVITRLSRVGYDSVLGYLEGGFSAWKKKGKPIEKINRISAQEFVARLKNQEPMKIIDVRKPTEYNAKHLPNSMNFPLAEIFSWREILKQENEHFYIFCQGGYRSMIAASILKMYGVEYFTEVEGGFGAIAPLYFSE